MGKRPQLSDEAKLEIIEHYGTHRNMSKTAAHFSKKWNRDLDRVDVRSVVARRGELSLGEDSEEIEEIENNDDRIGFFITHPLRQQHCDKSKSLISRVNFVYTDEHKKRRLNELDDNEAELPVLLSNNSYSFTDGHKEELIEYYNQAGFQKITLLLASR